MKISIAVIGYGNWGRNLCRTFHNSPDFHLAQICDQKNQINFKVKTHYPQSSYSTDAISVFSDKDIQAVAIATGPESHFELCRAALANEKHLFVEKPMTLNSGDADLLVSLVKENNLTLMVDHTAIFTPAMRTLKDEIMLKNPDGICSFTSVRKGPAGKNTRVNILWDLAPHDLAVLKYLFGMHPCALRVSIKNNIHKYKTSINCAEVFLEFNNNFEAHLIFERSADRQRQITVTTETGQITCDESQETSRINKNRGGEVIDIKSSKDKDALFYAAQDFARSVKSGNPPVSGCEMGSFTVHAIEAMHRSISNGGKWEKIFL